MKVQINLFLNVWIDVVSLSLFFSKEQQRHIFERLSVKYLATGLTVGILAQGKNHQAYRLAESQLGGGVLFDTTLPGLEPGIAGVTFTSPSAESRTCC